MPDTGWIIAASAVNDDAKGTVAWSNPGRVIADDESYANAPVATDESNWLRSSHDFENMLPINSIITGVECRVQIKGVAAKLERVIEIQLHNGVEFIGTAKTPNTTIPDSDTDLDFGGEEDTWDAVLNLIQIGFCAAPVQFGYRIDGDAFGAAGNCDATWMKLHYGERPDRPGGGAHFPHEQGPTIPGTPGDFI